MSVFRKRLQAAPAWDPAQVERWVYVPYDQLDPGHPLLRDLPPRHTAVVLIESPQKAHKRPYHKQKLALLLASQRHFALECAEAGHPVVWHVSDGSFGDGLLAVQARYGLGTLHALEPAERELRVDLAEAVAAGLRLLLQPNTLWLTEPADFAAACGSAPPWRMDAFYRHVRRKTGVLMQAGKPVGGKFSFDAENRQPWRGTPAVPPLPRYQPDAVTTEVLQLVEHAFAGHFGDLAGFAWPVTAAEVADWWAHVRSTRLPHFGPFEDAMAEAEPLLFHARISPLVNLGRLPARQVLRDVLADHAAGGLPLASAEGFVRQLLGWREYVRHVHQHTDGFRQHLPANVVEDQSDLPQAEAASPNALRATEPLPPVFWGKHQSGLRCLDTVVADVVRDGWSHHITRLMVLSNIASLLGVQPRALTDWFWVAYVDAYDWVVEPNVLGMGTWADGGAMMTKPYVSGAAYLRKMGDACRRCVFDPTGKDPRRPCPLTPLYWQFLQRNQPALARVERLSLPLALARQRTSAQRTHDAEVHARVLTTLRRGERLAVDVAADEATCSAGPGLPKPPDLACILGS